MDTTRNINADVDDDIHAISFQLQEIESHLASLKQKYLEGRATDYEIAVDNFKTELHRRLLFFSDQRLARTVQNNDDDDAGTTIESATEDDQSHINRIVVPRTNGEATQIEDTQSLNGGDQARDNSSFPDSTPVTAPISHVDVKDIPGPSIFHERRQRGGHEPLPLSLMDCVVCGDLFHSENLIRGPCSDPYCSGCLKSLFIRSITDETLYPPRCCGQAIPLLLVEDELSIEELSDFRSAAIEFTTTNRTYCAKKDCGRFIPPDCIHSASAVCPKCDTETCTYCKETFHGGDCPEDEALQAVLTLAQAEHWRRCYGCKAIVELYTGCNHMTCKCSAEFCYVCGVQWKDCTCDIWEERNLLRRAEQVVDREVNYPLAAPERQHRVVQMQRELRENHECSHPGRWEKQEGYQRKGFRCEICSARHWKYILRCRHCHVLACEDCRRHRV